MDNIGQSSEDWWTAQEAGRRVGLNPETIRNWARKGRIRRRALPGTRLRHEFAADDILSLAPAARGAAAMDEELSRLRDENAALKDRNVILEDVLRRYRYIDEHREEIDRAHREIENLLQGEPPIPNN